MGIETAASALQAFSTAMQVTANNIANMNTPGFQAGQVQLAESGAGGVVVAGVQPDTTSGGLVPSLVPLENPETGQTALHWQPVEASNTDLTREMVDMIAWQRGYEANIAVIQTEDEMRGAVLDLLA